MSIYLQSISNLIPIVNFYIRKEKRLIIQKIFIQYVKIFKTVLSTKKFKLNNAFLTDFYKKKASLQSYHLVLN